MILFFNGWGMDTSAIRHLDGSGYALVELNDYSTINFCEEEYAGYEEIYVVAWSLGVWVASEVLHKSNLKLKKVIAINGTLNPIHHTEGIHPTVFEQTINGWNETNSTRFLRRVVGSRKELALHEAKFASRPVEEQKKELEALQVEIKASRFPELKFDVALIGVHDAIFSAKNQHCFWQNKSSCIELDMPHYPFLKFSNWNDIIEL